MTDRNGSWIRSWRAEHGYTQEALASELGVKRQTVIGWERAARLERMTYLALRALEFEENRQMVRRG